MYTHNQDGSTYTATTKSDMVTHIEELLGSEGSRPLAEAMVPILEKECYLTFDGHEYTLQPVAEDIWQSIESDASDVVRTTYQVRMEGASETFQADDLEDAKEHADEWAREGTWDTSGGTIWVHAVLIDPAGERHTVTVTIDPPEPVCTDLAGHDWQNPFDLVGGIKENPGVWGHGGGVTIQEVCIHCGCGKLVDTWAQDPETGKQGLTSIQFEPGKYQIEEQEEE